MPKQTFYNLTDEKKKKIFDSLRKLFKNKSIFEVSVKEIVDDLEIARGSFYQYFEDLNDAYFMILDTETVDIHKLFLDVLKENSFDLIKSLNSYKIELSKILFSEDVYMIYKNRFLYWTSELEIAWSKYKKDYDNDNTRVEKLSVMNTEKMNFIKAVIHNLIERNYLEAWRKDEFLTHYDEYIKFLEGGIKKWWD